jgi:hypothetical protein
VRFTRPGLTEEYSVSVDGVRQDFIIESPPLNPSPSTLNPQPSTLNHSAGDLRVELALSGARAEAAAGGARLRLEGSGRTLAYSRLRVEDATGQELTARLEVLSADRLVVSVADANATYPVRIDPTFSDADWVSLGSGMNSSVNALALIGTNLYAGGGFTTAGGVAANYIAKWNGSAWSALGWGINNSVCALAVSGTNLYAGGNFTIPGGGVANYIAKWDGTAWSALGSGVNGYVDALAVSGTNLYAGGGFTSAGGVYATNIAKWDGRAWSALGLGTGGSSPWVSALAVIGTDLYAGGWCTTAGGVPATYITKWNGTAWSALGSGVNAPVNALAVIGTILYVGGDFTTAGGVPAKYIARWDGSAWSALGSGIGYGVSALAVIGTNLYAGGQFTTAGGVYATNIAKWDGSAWSALGSGVNGGGVRVLAADGAGHLFVGGPFSLAGTNVALGIAEADLGTPGSPLIVASPASLAVNVGATADFQVAANGSPPLVYQWVFNGTTAIAGATNSVLSLTNVQLPQAGVYTIVVTNAYGAATSGPAILDVLAPGNTVVTAPLEAALRAVVTGGGTVTFACDGTITLASTITNTLDTVLDGSGHQITISGSNACRVFFVNSNVNLTLVNLTIANGLSANGGGIYNEGTLNATNCRFVANTAQGAPGADFTVPASPGQDGSGGAVYNSGALNIIGCLFAGNSACGGAGGWGQGGFIDTYAGGVGGAGNGGAICNLGLLAVSGSTFWCNSAFGGLGGCGGSGGMYGVPPIPGATGGAGGAGNGSALFNGGSASLVNSTFALNSGSGAEGGAGGDGGSLPISPPGGAYGGNGGGGGSAFGTICGNDQLLTNCTLAFNSGYAGGGGPGGAAGGPSGQPGSSGSPGAAFGCLGGGQLVNTLLASNVPLNCSGTIDAGHNLSSDGSCGFTGIGSLNNIDPKLGPLADNGGPTPTMALLPGSPAIDAGDTSVAPATDQRGFPRPAGLAADIGAYEYGSVMPTVAISGSGANVLNILASGNSNQSCRLLSSTDLLNWVPIATDQFGTNGTILFYDTYAPGSACRFYRLVMP